MFVRGRLRMVIGVLLLIAFPFAARAAEQPRTPLQVFVSILPQKYFVERVGGQRVAVSVLVGPGRSPETYEPSPRQLTRLAQARIYFRIGVEFEEAWMERLAAAEPGMRIVDLRRGLKLRPMDSPVQNPADAHGLPDPHVWTSPPLVKVMAATIRDTLAELDPAHRAEYDANLRAFAADLDQLDREIRALLAGTRTRSFMVFHPAWGYFADTYGLKQIAIEAGGKEPGGRALAGVIAIGRREGVKAIFVQAQFSRRVAETIAQSLGARVVAVDPLAEDYPDNLRSVARAFAGSLQ